MTERERFESWLRSIGIEPTYTLDGDYSGDAVCGRWETWQAALKWNSDERGEPCNTI